ncbi:MAG: PAS-domain containing protein [Rhodocyclaceae bacterium]|jgi:PAS domain S-box-containing protein|nr:PAS-domain containing protein [Rhodocyclaceae bacterium]
MPSRSASSPPPPASGPLESRHYDLLLAGLDLLDQAVAVFDGGARLLTWNTALLRLLDLPESLVRSGVPFEAFIRFNAERGEYGPGLVDELVATRMAPIRARQAHSLERVRPNGQILAVREVPMPGLGFVSLWTDITAQRGFERLIKRQNTELEERVRARTRELESANLDLLQAKAELAAVNSRLARSEERLALIMDAIPALICYCSADERYLFANRGYAEWFGLTKENIVGRTVAEVLGPDAYRQVQPHQREAATGQRTVYEYARRNTEGRTVHARSAVVPELSEDGSVRGFFVLSIDITEQKASQAALIQAQKMEAVGQLTGGLAHDFNNLLTIIIGNLASLDEKLAPGDPAGGYVTPALQAAQRGAELIRRLLTFSRGQALEPCAVEVGALVSNMTALLSRSLGGAIHLRTVLPAQPLHALVDPHPLENTLLNLALNARDAMPEGGDLTISAQPIHLDAWRAKRGQLTPGEYVLVEVSDTGLGIEPALQPRVFEPFFTTKPFGSGSGLGLSMVYGFVRQSGGNIEIQSQPGRGTTVSFVLPATPPPPEPAPPLSATPGGIPAAQLPVLLVEDEPEVRRVIRQQLVELGHPVIEASNGLEALDLLQILPDIGILVSDTVMPGGMDGRELARQSQVLRPALPILLITGYADQEAPEDIPVLRKPFARAALEHALNHLLLTHPDSTE